MDGWAWGDLDRAFDGVEVESRGEGWTLEVSSAAKRGGIYTLFAIARGNALDAPGIGEFVESTVNMQLYLGDCLADLNGDTTADFFDLSILLSGSVDYNGDTVFDFFDISAFLQDLAVGCE